MITNQTLRITAAISPPPLPKPGPTSSPIKINFFFSSRRRLRLDFKLCPTVEAPPARPLALPTQATPGLGRGRRGPHSGSAQRQALLPPILISPCLPPSIPLPPPSAPLVWLAYTRDPAALAQRLSPRQKLTPARHYKNSYRSPVLALHQSPPPPCAA